jgi:uncharacterized protein (DUF1810 family)
VSRLDRFKTAQASHESGFETALHEIRAGAKLSHWIWYVFPQISGLGLSDVSQAFAIDGAEEAAEFLRDAELRSRLLTITTAVAEQLRADRPKSLRTLMGSDTDARKLVSSLTLFGGIARTLNADAAGDEYRAIADVAADVLSAAESQGYPPCSYTLDRLRRTV